MLIKKLTVFLLIISSQLALAALSSRQLHGKWDMSPPCSLLWEQQSVHVAQALIQNGVIFKRESEERESIIWQSFNLQLQGDKSACPRPQQAQGLGLHRCCTMMSIIHSQNTRDRELLLSSLPPNLASFFMLVLSPSPASPAQHNHPPPMPRSSQKKQNTEKKASSTPALKKPSCPCCYRLFKQTASFACRSSFPLTASISR